MKFETEVLLALFKSNSRPFGKCIYWKGCRDKDGYGELSIPKKGSYRVHRLIAHFFHGLDIDNPKLFACHNCDNPSCINPEHIFIGTHSENMRDAKQKGRAFTRDTLGGTKLSTKQVKRLVKLYLNGSDIPFLHKKFGISRTHVGRLLKQHNIKVVGIRSPQVVICNETGKTFATMRDAGEEYGFHSSNLGRHLNGKIKSLKGLTFKKVI